VHYPQVATALLIEDFDHRSITEQLKELGFIPTIYSPHYSLLNAEKIAMLHQQNIKVIPWTVNDLPTIQQLQKLQVDGIITDYPNLF
jgi:glycerophosphoryl diester phosphodiesterase